MLAFVAGASGATGRLLVQELLERGNAVRAVVRSPEKLSAASTSSPRLSIITASLLDLTDDELATCVQGCNAIASCLGHTLTLRGVFGPPRRLVFDATRRLCEAVAAARTPRPVRFVLMNTAGNRNRDLNEPISYGERCVIAGVRLLVPPHADNERAADYLRVQVGQRDGTIEWAVVRPDTLFDADRVSPYVLVPSPTRSATFDAGRTSRINVAHFMADLITDDDVWHRWRGQMPVIYDEEKD